MSLVDYDDDSDGAVEGEDAGKEKSFSFTNFLFGNVSENGELETDYLDEETKEHLENLSSRGLDCLATQIREVNLIEEYDNDADGSSLTRFESKSPDELVVLSTSAVDFYEINETVEDNDYDSEKQSSNYPLPTGASINEDQKNSVLEIALTMNEADMTRTPFEKEPELTADVERSSELSEYTENNETDSLALSNSTESLGLGVIQLPAVEENQAEGTGLTLLDKDSTEDTLPKSDELILGKDFEVVPAVPADKIDDNEAIKQLDFPPEPKEIVLSDIENVPKNLLDSVELSQGEHSVSVVQNVIDYPADITGTQEDISTSNIENVPENQIATAGPSDALHQEADSTQKRLNTPLASVLPPELANINVNDVFPEFKPDVVLRFSRLFGPGRPSSLPKRWVNFRKNPESEPGIPIKETSDDEDDETALDKILAESWPMETLEAKSSTNNVNPTELEAAVENIPDTSTVESEAPKRLNSSAIAAWRYGPAKFWYDQLDVDPTGENFDYGAKRPKNLTPNTSVGYGSKVNMKLDLDDEAFLMVSLTNWEQDVIWDGAAFKTEVDKILSEKRTAAGWIPNFTYRTAAAFLAPHKLAAGQQPPPLDLKNDSMFPAENEELNDGSWMKDIIWDANSVEDLPEPTVLMLDPNDPNIILDFPEEEEYEVISKEPVVTHGKEKKDVFKRSRMVLGKAGMLKEPESPKMPDEPKDQWKDPFNLSNDEYYSPKIDDTSLKSTTGAVVVQHSIPILRLESYFAPPNMTMSRLRRYHRPELKKYSNGLVTHSGPHPIENLMRNIKKRMKQREVELAASGGGEMFFMREPEDLSICDGDLILAEYCEEYPPLMSQIGMATRIKNYFKRKPGKNEEEIPEFAYGELTQAHTSPFLGTLAPGQCIQAFENNMFRAPIYQHVLSSTDFLVIRTRNHYFIRDIRVIFTVGQECPLIEVPAPNSKKATNFARDFLQVNIYRLFAKSTESPKRLRTEDVKKLFVHSSESTVRKRLKICAEFQRSGSESHWWSLRPDFRLPSEEELREKVTPEDYCAFYSMKSAEQRLKDAGYGEKLILAMEDDGDEEMQSKMDDEIKAAPWNTTRAFIAAMKNKCILQLTGDADPTGRGEGFSYVKVPNKAQEKDGLPQAKRIVTGTDADLRKLSLNNAKQLLRKYGCNDDQIKKLTRWEIIDLVRTLGTQQARAGAEESMSKFARGSRYSAIEQQEKYKEDCQRIFELQNRILASEETLSTDEESSEDEDDSDLEQLAGDLEEFIQSKKSSKEIRFEREEEERKELKKLLNQEEAAAKILQKKKIGKKKGCAEEEQIEELPPPPVRKLRIVRTFRDTEGREFDRVEFVSRPALIDAYVRIRTTKDRDFIQSFTALETEKKEKVRKYTRRLHDPNKKAAKEGEVAVASETISKKKPKKDAAQLKVKCGACGEIGHMRTNKVCPMAGETFNVAMTKEQEERQIGSVIEDSGLVKVEGAKITLKKEVLNQTEEIRRKSLIVKIPKQLTEPHLQFEREERRQRKKERRDRERLEQDEDRDVLRKKRRIENLPEYLEKPHQLTVRRRVNPVVSLSGYLEEILNKIRELPGLEPFRAPVSLKSCPDYLMIIQTPMDLGTMRIKLNEMKYHRREEFLEDLSQIVKNCSMYNGPNCKLTTDAHKMIQVCLDHFQKDEERFKKLEKMINPLLDDNDQNALSYIFEQIINTKLKSVEGSSLFHVPVNRKMVKDYYDIIQNPMDFETMLHKTKSHRYQTAEQFLADIELIRLNCFQYNTADSPFSKTAAEIVRMAKSAVEEQMEYITAFETAIKSAQEAAMEDGDTESIGTAGSDSDRLTNRLESASGDLMEEDTRQTGMSDLAEDDVMIDLPLSPAANAEREEPSRMEMDNDDRVRELTTPDEPEPTEDESFSRQTENDDTGSPPMRKKQLRLSMGGAYYDDARTGYDDESNQAMECDEKPREDAEVVSTNASSSPQPGPSRVSTLEEDLHVSDSESDEDRNDEQKKIGDEDEDGLWF